MKRPCATALISLLMFWLAAGVPSALGADLAHFKALNLTRFPKPVVLPDIRLSDTEGKPVSLRSFQGKVVMLNFWTTW